MTYAFPSPPLIPSTASQAQLQAWLADAQNKLHLLRTGRLSIEVEVEGRRVRYQRTDEDALESYIQDIQDAISMSPRRRGAIGFLF